MKLKPVEKIALTIARAQLKRGGDVTTNIATVLIWALIRNIDGDDRPAA